MKLAALLVLAACGGGGDGGGPCTLDGGVAADLGQIDTTLDSNVHRSPMLKNVFLEVFLDEDLAPDILHLELYGGQGAFRGGDVRPGSYPLSGAESSYASCGACLLLLVDRDPGSLRPSAYFIAESGTLSLVAVTDRLTGELSDVTLRHVTIDFTDPDGTGPLQASLATATASSCRTHIARAAFDIPYQEEEQPDAGP